MRLVSACLAGVKCTYNGKSKKNENVIKKLRKDDILICPEVLGGLPTPRPPTGIYGGLGKDVLSGKAKVLAARDGRDKTAYYVRGAEATLEVCKRNKIKVAILKDKSPSCGSVKTWQLDKKLYNHAVDGDGVVSALLKKNKIKVLTERDI